MYTLFKKEISAFFSSVMGYLTLVVFLLFTGLLLWVFRTDFNLLDYKYAGLDGLFLLSPWLYLFLIPAITMRMIAEEKRNGTMELLLTKPMGEFSIVFAKFLAGSLLVLISLLPTLVYYWAVYRLGDPVGNIDTGSVIGSYIGLLLLGCTFVSIGLFASSLTSNQIVAFIIAALLSFFCFKGFDGLYLLTHVITHGHLALLLRSLGIAMHYESMSHGLIDTRDLIYFLSIIALFVMMTRTVLLSRKWQL